MTPPTLTAMLGVLAEPEPATHAIARALGDADIPDADSAPLDAAIYAWIDAGCPMPAEAEPLRDVLAEIAAERERQDAKWGEQNHPSGTEVARHFVIDAQTAKSMVDSAAKEKRLHYAMIFLEEVAEAMEETDPAKLRAELVQVVAVGVAWIEAIDRRADK